MLQLPALSVDAFPKSLDYGATKEDREVLLVWMLAEDVFVEGSHWMLRYSRTLGVFGFIIGVVNQLEKCFLVAHVELSGHWMGALLGKKDKCAFAQVFVVPIVMLLVVDIVKLPFQRLAERSHDLFEIPLDVESTLNLLEAAARRRSTVDPRGLFSVRTSIGLLVRENVDSLLKHPFLL